MLTLRIRPELLAALKARARQARRSTSAEVTRMIEEDLARTGALPRPARPVRTAGMFAGLDAPDLDEIKAVRRRASEQVRARVDKARR